MKRQLILTCMALSFALAIPTHGHAQLSPAKPEATQEARGLARLTPEQREKLKAARQKAATDPAVVEARKVLREAVQKNMETLAAAVVKKDPSLQPVIDKLRAARPEPGESSAASGSDGADRPGIGGNRNGAAREAILTPEEREKLRAARAAVKDEPEVAAAIKDREQAQQAFRKAMRDAMVQADPSVAPYIDEVLSAAQNRPGLRRRGSNPE